MEQRTPPGLSAFALMILLCATWGYQQVSIKIASEGISPVLQSGLRSAIALLLLTLWARWRGLAFWQHDGTLRMGLLAGLLFAIEFLFIYLGLAYTTASRMIVFLYTAPCLTVLGLHWCVPGEQLRWRRSAASRSPSPASSWHLPARAVLVRTPGSAMCWECWPQSVGRRRRF